MKDVYNYQEIKEQAEKLLLETNTHEIFPCPVEQIINYLGYSAHTFDPSQQTDDVSGAVNYGEKKIYINANDSAQRKLFTAAHEIGHIKLHPNSNYIDFRDLLHVQDPKEKEANLFAACLLMPENKFRNLWQEYNGDIKKLSYYFGTSLTAISLRLEELGLD